MLIRRLRFLGVRFSGLCLLAGVLLAFGLAPEYEGFLDSRARVRTLLHFAPWDEVQWRDYCTLAGLPCGGPREWTVGLVMSPQMGEWVRCSLPDSETSQLRESCNLLTESGAISCFPTEPGLLTIEVRAKTSESALKLSHALLQIVQERASDFRADAWQALHSGQGAQSSELSARLAAAERDYITAYVLNRSASSRARLKPNPLALGSGKREDYGTREELAGALRATRRSTSEEARLAFRADSLTPGITIIDPPGVADKPNGGRLAGYLYLGLVSVVAIFWRSSRKDVAK